MREASPLSRFETRASQSLSFLRAMKRSALTPHVWWSPLMKRSSENGMRISTVHPSPSTVTAESHTASHDSSVQVSLKMTWSRCTPAAVTSNRTPVRRSRRGSRRIAKRSASEASSRRDSRRPTRSASRSNSRAPT